MCVWGKRTQALETLCLFAFKGTDKNSGFFAHFVKRALYHPFINNNNNNNVAVIYSYFSFFTFIISIYGIFPL